MIFIYNLSLLCSHSFLNALRTRHSFLKHDIHCILEIRKPFVIVGSVDSSLGQSCGQGASVCLWEAEGAHCLSIHEILLEVTDKSHIGIQHDDWSTTSTTTSSAADTSSLLQATAHSSRRRRRSAAATTIPTTDPLIHNTVVSSVDLDLIPIGPSGKDFKVSIDVVPIAATDKLAVVLII
jgi:hypothetical protein